MATEKSWLIMREDGTRLATVAVSSAGDGCAIEVYGVWLNQPQVAVIQDVLTKAFSTMQRKDIGKPVDSGPTPPQVPLPSTEPIPVVVDETGGGA
jgi:hypothetical protein